MSISHKANEKLHRILSQWSVALLHSVSEHSAPNSFGVVEVAKEFGLLPADGYRLGYSRLPDLTRLTGYPVTYRKGRFYVGAK